MYISAQTSYDRSTVKVWERTKEGRVTQQYPSPFYFFIEDEHGEYKDYKGTPLKKLEYDSFEEYFNAAKKFRQNGIQLWESDIPLEYKVLSQYYYGQDLSGKLNIGFYDIEIDYDKTRGMPDIYDNPYAPINAISLYTTHNNKTIVFAVPPNDSNFWYDDLTNDLKELAEIRLFKTEKELLLNFIDEVYDVDIISGWNSHGFDDIYTYNRLKMVCGEKIANKLSFEDARKPYFKEVFDEKKRQNKNVLIISGRVSLDLMQIMMKFEPGERDSFALEAVAEEKLENLEKLSYEGTLADLYRDDFPFFLKYNIRDCVILKSLEDKFGYLKLCILLSHMDTGLIEDVTGTIKLTEMAIINHCHHKANIRVKDKNYEINPSNEKFGGAIVLPPIPGLHKWIATIDVNSLYPSAMRTVNISFDTMIGQFTGNNSDFEKVRDKTNDKLTMVFEDGSVEIMTGSDWNEFLLEMGWCISGFGTVFTMEKMGIIPTLLTEWFSKRKEYKKKSFEYLNKYDETKKQSDYDNYRLYDLMQGVFKLKLNSTYGACGNKFFRFYDVRMAESTTKTGREVLFHMTKKISEQLDGNYVYPNNYVLGGDTDSVFFKTLENSYDECSIKAKKLANNINESFDDFAVNSFLINENYKGIFAVSQETVSDAAIITEGKKNYMMHAVEKDGKKTDKMIIKGLQIKKTNTPKPIRTLLINHFERLLKGEDWQSIGVSLLEQRERLLREVELNVDSLGLPTKVNSFENYLSVYENKTPGKTIPGHVMSCIFWNKCLEEYNDKNSIKIVSGMKVKKFYFKKPIENFKAIAMPVDLEQIPIWFLDNFSNKIDKEKQVVRIIDKVCQPILNAIGLSIPTRKTLLIEELVEF